MSDPKELSKRDFAEDLFSLLKSALWSQPLVHDSFARYMEQDWEYLFHMIQRQGLAAVVLDALEQLPVELRPEKTLLREWRVKCISSEVRWQKQLMTAAKTAEVLKQHGIRTLLLKGLGISLLYPVPKHRECGDIDIYLFGQYEEGNKLASEVLKAKIDKFNKKEDHLVIDGVAIDNHINFVWIGSKQDLSFNQYLKDLLAGAQMECFPETSLLLPPAEFNYLFMLRHSYEHFIGEGMPLRQMTDLACLLDKKGHLLNWNNLNGVLSSAGLQNFSDTIRSFISNYFGIGESPVCSDEKLLRQVQDDILNHGHQVVYHDSWLGHKKYIIQTLWKNRWKINAFYDGGFKAYIINKIAANITKI